MRIWCFLQPESMDAVRELLSALLDPSELVPVCTASVCQFTVKCAELWMQIHPEHARVFLTSIASSTLLVLHLSLSG